VNGVARPNWEAAVAALLVAGALAALTAGFLVDRGRPALAVTVVLLVGALVVRRPTVRWEHILGLLLLVILFIPIRRYRFPGDLPFQLEPYRVLVFVILVCWVASLLADGRVRLRRTGIEAPLLLILLAIVASDLANPSRFAELESNAVKAITFFLSFVLVLYFVAGIVRTQAIADMVAKTLVAGGAVLAVLAVIEARSGYTPFSNLDSVFPFLVTDPGFQPGIGRGGATRAFGPAEHPIAFSAALVLLVPLAVYVARISSRIWLLALVALVVGVLVTVSRTGTVMLVVVGLVFLWLRPRETRRLWPALIPILVVTQLAVPGTLGSLTQAFLPEGGLVQEQRGSEGSCSSAGRIADLDPTLAEVGKKPLLGYGYGTRVVTGPDANACILDNQWLGTLVEVGILGTLAWLWLFARVFRRFGGAAKKDPSPAGWLLVAITAAVAAFAVGMFTYDALGFVQVTFLLFVLLGLGAAVTRNQEAPVPELSPTARQRVAA
jgi:O-antigen ligase